MASEKPEDKSSRKVSRRQFVKGVGTATGAAVLSTSVMGSWTRAQEEEQEDFSYSPNSLTQAELATLTAVMARLIPADDWGGGAVEARAYVYVDRALAESYSEHLPAYQDGMAALDALAEEQGGDSFVGLNSEQQDEILSRLEAGEVEEVTRGDTRQGIPLGAGGQELFGLIRQHTLEGTFGDPMYGGNHEFLGWNLIGYPGVQVYYDEEEQAIDGPSELDNRSASDFGAEPVL